MSVADTHLVTIGGQEEVRVHLAEGGKGRVVCRCKGPKGSVHEVGDGGGLIEGDLTPENGGGVVSPPHTLLQHCQVQGLAGVD